jgi:uncharacterized membrane protein YfcA
MPEQLPLVLLIVAAAASVRTLFGFGDALVAMPLLALTVGLQTGAPLMALLSGAIAFTMLLSTWRSVHIESAWRLIVFAVCGVPIGSYFLKGSYETVMTALFGCFVLGFAVYSLWAPRTFTLNTDRWAFVFGFIAGILGGAYNTNGPVVVMYGTFRRWSPEEFRATLQGFFMCSGAAILIAHGANGLWTREVLLCFVAALPVVLAIVFIGGRFARRFEAERFRRYVYYLLLILGASLIVQTLRST